MGQIMRQRLWIGYALALLLLGWHALAQAQGQPTCTQSRINNKGTSGASITVDNTVVNVAEANSARCTLAIFSETTNVMRCSPVTGKYALTPTTTVGALWPISTAPQFILGMQAQEAWSCIRTGGSSNTVTVIEGMP